MIEDLIIEFQEDRGFINRWLSGYVHQISFGSWMDITGVALGFAGGLAKKPRLGLLGLTAALLPEIYVLSDSIALRQGSFTDNWPAFLWDALPNGLVVGFSYGAGRVFHEYIKYKHMHFHRDD